MTFYSQVNHHKFVDEHTLLTASDDSAVLLWDLRCLGTHGGGGVRAAGRAIPVADRALVDRFCGRDLYLWQSFTHPINQSITESRALTLILTFLFSHAIPQ